MGTHALAGTHIYSIFMYAIDDPRFGAAMSPRVLLVEDDANVRRVIRRILERGGYEVVEAASGGDALRLLPEIGEVALVVCDVVMPRMSGMQFVLELLRARPGTPYLFVTGWSDHPEVATADAQILSK